MRIDPDIPSLQLACNSVGTLDVPRPDGSTQAHARLVCQLNSLFIVLEGEERNDWTCWINTLLALVPSE